MYESYIYPAETARMLARTAGGVSSTPASSQSAAMPLRTIEPSPHKEFKDSVLNAVVALACETAMAGYGALVFAGSRQSCESVARWISRAMPSPDETQAAVLDTRLDVLSELQSLSTALDPVLADTIPFGVGFHRRLKLFLCRVAVLY